MRKGSGAKRLCFVCCALVLMMIMNFFNHPVYSYTPIQKNVLLDKGDTENAEDQVLFLSDIDYSKAQVGWGNISFDKTQSNTPLTLILDGASTVFKKGIWAHATSTIEYDISAYKDYA